MQQQVELNECGASRPKQMNKGADIKLTQFIEPIEFINLIHLLSSRLNLSLITLGFLVSS